MADRRLVAGSRGGPDKAGASADRSPLFEHMRHSGRFRDTLMLTTDFDGTERMISYRRLANYPLLVAVALAKDEILADWRTVTWQEAAAIVFVLGTRYALGGWLLARIRNAQRLEVRLRRAQSDLQAKNTELDRMARTDALTGLANRRYLDERLAAEVEAADAALYRAKEAGRNRVAAG